MNPVVVVMIAVSIPIMSRTSPSLCTIKRVTAPAGTAALALSNCPDLILTMVAATTNTITHPCANQRVDDDSKITLTSSDISAGRRFGYSLHTSLTFLGEDEGRAIQDTVATGSVEESGSDFSAGKCSDKLRSNLSVARQDIALSSPHASSLQTSDSDHAHPLVSPKHSQTEHQLDRKGKRRATDKDQQRDSAEEDRSYRGRYVHRRDAGTSLIGN